MKDRWEDRIRWGDGRMGAGPPSRPSCGPDGKPFDEDDWREASSLVAFSLTLVLIMASVLFVTVGLNPKGDGYAPLAWTYAVLCLVGGAGCWFASRALSRT
jgi:hypothetical protein